MIIRPITALLTSPHRVVGEDGQGYFEPGSPLSSHASPRCPARPQPRWKPHPNRWAAAR